MVPNDFIDLHKRFALYRRVYNELKKSINVFEQLKKSLSSSSVDYSNLDKLIKQLKCDLKSVLSFIHKIEFRLQQMHYNTKNLSIDDLLSM